MPFNPARLRWLIRLDDEDEGETGSTGDSSSSSCSSSSSMANTDEDLLAALRSLPSWQPPAEEEGGSVNAGGCGGDRHLGALPRPLPPPPPLPTTPRNYARPLDRRRALASRLAQHVAVCAGLGVEWERSPGISRTLRGGKPFVARGGAESTGEGGGGGGGGGAGGGAPNFNFNVSHDGPWLALAAEPLLLVGVDVASPRAIGGGGGGERGGGGGAGTADEKNRGPSESRTPPPLGAARLQRSLGSALSDSEWSRVALEPGAASQDAMFRRFWALREAWSKARGDGLGAADLARAEFSIGGGSGGSGGEVEEGGGGGEKEEKDLPSPPPPPPPRIALRLDGVLQEQWSFELRDLPDGSALAVALGPPSAAVDAGGTFLKTLGRASMPRDEVEGALRECRRWSREEAAARGKSGSFFSWRRMSVRALIEEAEMRKKGGEERETTG